MHIKINKDISQRFHADEVPTVAGRTLPNGHLNRREQPRLSDCRGGRTQSLSDCWKEPQTPQHDRVDEVPTTLVAHCQAGTSTDESSPASVPAGGTNPVPEGSLEGTANASNPGVQ